MTTGSCETLEQREPQCGFPLLAFQRAARSLLYAKQMPRTYPTFIYTPFISGESKGMSKAKRNPVAVAMRLRYGKTNTIMRDRRNRRAKDQRAKKRDMQEE